MGYTLEFVDDDSNNILHHAASGCNSKALEYIINEKNYELWWYATDIMNNSKFKPHEIYKKCAEKEGYNINIYNTMEFQSN